MTVRGVRKESSFCTTSAMRGVFQDNQSTRTERLALVYGRRRAEKLFHFFRSARP